MSMNISIVGQRNIRFDTIRVEHNSIQRINFSQAYQTPTDVTRKIMTSTDPLATYSEWIKSIRTERVIDVYAEDDILCDREPVGTETVCYEDEHLEELKDFIEQCTLGGFTVMFEEC